MKIILSITLGILAAAVSHAQSLNHLFKSGEEGYACFRIPAIVATTDGTLLAFAEGRKKGCSDTGDIDLVLKRSEDGGKTWSGLTVVWDDGDNVCGNPAPVVDGKTGKILLLSTWNLGSDHESQIIEGTSKDTRRVFLLTSLDNGISWSEAREITSSVKKPDWTWYATGPCNGIQIRKGAFKGRLIIPCDHIEAVTKKYYSHTIHSDDGGISWTLGGTTPTDQVNECTVAELRRGKLLLNMRNYTTVRVRQVAESTDGGLTWMAQRGDSALPEPVCQASMVSRPRMFGQSLLAFSNPASQTKRENLTLKISRDGGRTWPVRQVIYPGPAAYSNLVFLPGGNVGCLYEAGVKSPYEGIVFSRLRTKKSDRH